MVLAWAFRLETFGIVNASLGYHRGLVPLVGGALLLAVFALWEGRMGRRRG